jgi:putative inorganic carbon (HCO3(-)) transporter
VGTGIGHYIPLIAYLGFWVMCLMSLSGRPVLGLYYMMPFIPYRTMRDHFEDYPLGGNMLTILVIAVIVGALIKGKRLPPSKLYLTWLIFGVYLYLSMWIGTVLTNAPAPLWLGDVNFVTWKDYMLIPMLFVAAGLVIEDRKAVRTVVIITAISLFLVDKSALAESLSRSWSVFDEEKRTSGPLVYGPNQLAAFLAQFAMFFWGFAVFMKRFKVKLLCYALVGFTIITTMYTFSRGAYLALIAAAFVLAILKDRKLLVFLAVFLLTWQTIVPTAVTERVSMTKDSNGALEASAQERVDLWAQSEQMFLSSPIVGTGYATFQFGEHTDNLKDTHNWFVKVLVETGIVGGLIAFVMLIQMLMAGFSLFRKAEDPLYKGLGLGFLVAVCSCIVANCFGDRWTYVEINGLLWILAGATVRSSLLAAQAPAAAEQLAIESSTPSLAPHLEWR